jgi:hypothetical protein
MADDKRPDPADRDAPKVDDAVPVGGAPAPAPRSCQHTQKELDEALKEYLEKHPEKGK